MEKLRIPLWAPLAFLFAVGTVAFVLPAWTDATLKLAKLSGVSSDWAGFAGSLISAVITLTGTFLAAYAAWKSIVAQNRVSILTREEDRIEREMPGLKEAAEYTSRMSLFLAEDIGPKGAYRILSHEGYGDLSIPTRKTVDALLPNSLPHVRARLANTLDAIRLNSRLVTDLEVNVEDALGHAMAGDPTSAERWKRRHDELFDHRSMWRLYLGFLRTQSEELHARIKKLEWRQETCRKQIDDFFGD